MSESQSPKVSYDVFSIHEYVQDKQFKSLWTQVGKGFVNSNGSYNLRLHALPLTDPKTGLANLHMRLHVDKEESEVDDTQISTPGTQSESQSPKVSYDVFSIHEYVQDKQLKSLWIRVGKGFVNSDGSYNLHLHALPLTDPKTGLANLHMRLHHVDKEESEVDDTQIPNPGAQEDAL